MKQEKEKNAGYMIHDVSYMIHDHDTRWEHHLALRSSICYVVLSGGVL